MLRSYVFILVKMLQGLIKEKVIKSVFDRNCFIECAIKNCMMGACYRFTRILFDEYKDTGRIELLDCYDNDGNDIIGDFLYEIEAFFRDVYREYKRRVNEYLHDCSIGCRGYRLKYINHYFYNFEHTKSIINIFKEVCRDENICICSKKSYLCPGMRDIIMRSEEYNIIYSALRKELENKL